MLFFLVFGLGAAFGWETGYGLNLARDFPPRVMSYALGYGNEVWTAGGHYFWVGLTSSCSGRLLTEADTHGHTVSRLHIRRLPLRRVHLYRAKSDQLTISGPGSFPASQERGKGKVEGATRLTHGLIDVVGDLHVR